MTQKERDLYNSYCDLFETHYKKLTAFAYSRGLSWDDAEDVVQDVFLGMWKRRDKMYDGYLRNYVYKAVVSYANQVHRIGKYRQGKQDDYETFVMYSPPENEEREKEIRELLANAIECLPPAQQKIVVLFYLKGKRQRDIATMLGLSYNTVKNQASKGIKRIKEELQQTS